MYFKDIYSFRHRIRDAHHDVLPKQNSAVACDLSQKVEAFGKFCFGADIRDACHYKGTMENNVGEGLAPPV